MQKPDAVFLAAWNRRKRQKESRLMASGNFRDERYR